MMSLPSTRKTVDSRGSSCPGPLTDLFKAYRQASVGDVIDLLATDPVAESDVEAWATRSGNRVIEVVHETDFLRITVEIVRKGR